MVGEDELKLPVLGRPASSPLLYQWYKFMQHFKVRLRCELLITGFVDPALARCDIGARLSVRPFTIYLDRRSLVHSNDLFPKTNAPMVLKFQMLHYQTPRPQNYKIQPGREFKMADNTKISKG